MTASVNTAKATYTAYGYGEAFINALKGVKEATRAIDHYLSQDAVATTDFIYVLESRKVVKDVRVLEEALDSALTYQTMLTTPVQLPYSYHFPLRVLKNHF